jgi:hypothetical protein
MAGTANPSTRLPGPTASEILAWAEKVEDSAAVAAKALREEAQIVYMGIRNSGKLPAGIEKIPAARRVRRPLLKTAEMFEASAVAMRTFRHAWLSQFGDPNSINNRRKRGIDVNA